jgi:hypothetical protein
LYNSEPFISQEILIATGNSTSIRTSAAYTPSLGPSFQSSHTHIVSALESRTWEIRASGGSIPKPITGS